MIVTAAVIFKNGKILIGKRKQKWEFPGGKLEENESLEECIKREIEEELGIEINVIKKFCVERKEGIELHVFIARYKNGEAKPNFHNEIRWISIEKIFNYDFLDLDKKVAKRIYEAFKGKSNQKNREGGDTAWLALELFITCGFLVY